MAAVLPPSKVILLAAQLAATGAIASLASLTAQNGDVLRLELVLRLLLTYLPTRLPTADYVGLLVSLDAEDFSVFFPLAELDSAAVDGLSDEQAANKVHKLRLQPLDLPGQGRDNDNDTPPDPDPLAAFLILRAYAVDDGAGALPELPALVAPFLDRPTQRLRTWAVSTLLPLLRRNCDFYPDRPLPLTLADFEHLPDRLAVSRLLSQTGAGLVGKDRDSDRDGEQAAAISVARDLRGLIGPWLYDEQRWTSRMNRTDTTDTTDDGLCPGWEEALRWLTTQAAQPASWRVAVAAVSRWDGPSDVDLGGFGTMWLNDDEQEYLERRYARAALAVVYLLPEASAETLASAHDVVVKMRSLLDLDQDADENAVLPPERLSSAASLLPPIAADIVSRTLAADAAATTSTSTSIPNTPNTPSSFLRCDLLSESNALTTPSSAATELLHALVLSAHLLTCQLGCPSSVRQAAELVLLLRGPGEQQAVAAKAVHWVAANGPKGEDRFWIKARNEILWLRDWGADEQGRSSVPAQGVFGHVSRDFIEVEFLKALLANTRYSLARALYEDSPDRPLSTELLQDTVFSAAMSAYDNASNPNRTRGGLKKCDDIIHAFPKTIDRSLPAAQHAEALVAATHALSTYRLVLKQGEPFTPVVLRVHPDPISILGKVLEQNPKSYTQVQALVDVAVSMVDAGLAVSDGGRNCIGHSQKNHPLAVQHVLAGRRVTAMCIDAALNEDDFETAYSYVVSRLSATDETILAPVADIWSWRAALEAGKYRRSDRTVRPTHLGTASANLDIRHLEQRIECLAAALRIAPADTLQEILSAYRRCEEELEAAVLAEAEQEAAWDNTATSWPNQQQRQLARTSSPAAMPGGFEKPHVPRNLAALSSLRQTRQIVFGGKEESNSPAAPVAVAVAAVDGEDSSHQHRKRDQLREAAMGTITSGVGWLIGAHPVDRGSERG
ncbi:protein transport protein [Grosmannia clavigera kw1407]|uniref:Protein transport protein n=1 Tax=Grosmannia clavigera (strain kw1407 / UAMH 11150) TaxID=655863 RepID=F0XM83_GROCL|nr:protein transport protein [Grosmannia clavigera kw1407]EFX01140.1 protein transport protein [Grosmannia clavigera kw1407]